MRKRLFTFGCSYTRYRWPTWADFIQFNYDEYHNWAVPGSDNYLIFHSIIEAHTRHKFTSNDTVIIMWTMPMRLSHLTDEYIWQIEGLGWPQQSGKIINSLSETHMILMALNFIQMAQVFLDSMRVNYLMTDIYPTYIDKKTLANFPQFTIYLKSFKQEKWINPPLGTWAHLNPEPPQYFAENHEYAGLIDQHPSPTLHFNWAEFVLSQVLDIEIPKESFHLLKNWKKDNYQTPKPERIGKLLLYTKEKK